MLYAFRAFDKDGNGKIDINELKETLGGDEQVEESVWLSMIAEIDKNGDGEIDLKEFMNMMLQEVENIEK